jgi:hypothetical protein
MGKRKGNDDADQDRNGMGRNGDGNEDGKRLVIFLSFIPAECGKS